ncbi:MAG: hypothetical protein ACRDI0_06075 [Actinomycetota bacterium]
MAARSTRAGTAPLVGAYLTYGAFWGVWVVVFEAFLVDHGLSPGGLSLQFVALAVTAVAVMAFVAPRLEPRSRRATVTVAFDAAGVAMVALAPTAWLFAEPGWPATVHHRRLPVHGGGLVRGRERRPRVRKRPAASGGPVP